MFWLFFSFHSMIIAGGESRPPKFKSSSVQNTTKNKTKQKRNGKKKKGLLCKPLNIPLWLKKNKNLLTDASPPLFFPFLFIFHFQKNKIIINKRVKIKSDNNPVFPLSFQRTVMSRKKKRKIEKQGKKQKKKTLLNTNVCRKRIDTNIQKRHPKSIATA